MKKTLLIVLIIGVAFVVSGCTKTAEKVAENAIESTSGVNAAVDIDNDSLTVNTDQGSLQVGEEVKLPDNFPADVHVTDGTISSALETSENNGFSVYVTSSKSVSDLKTEYQEELANDGWEINSTLDVTTITTISASKDNRIVTVGISESQDGDGTAVSVTTSDVE